MSTLKTTNIAHPSSASNNIVLDSSGNVSIDAGTLYVDASNNRVGIGTTTPGAPLEVNGGDGILVKGSSTDSFLQNYATANNYIEFKDAGGSAGNINYNHTSDYLSFKINGAERFRCDSSGRLLVGTSTSFNNDALIQSYKASGPNRVALNSNSLANGQSVTFSLSGNGNREGSLGIYKHSGITNACAYLNLQEEDGNQSYLWTDNSGNFRISNNAEHIGTTSGTVVGAQTSDERIKNILGPVDYGLDTLKQIEPVRYSLKSEPTSEKIGFIAQQVQPLVPESVFDTDEHIEGEPEDAPTKLGMEYVALIPVLVNAIKELSAEVDALKAQLQAS